MSEICKNNCQNPYNICYDNYLNTNACTECTGLICTPAKDNDEWESYRKIFDFIPEPPESNIPPCKEASMDEDTLKKITQGFGAGLGTMAGTCGAISGAAVVAGLINQDKAGTSQTVRSVMNQFKQQNGTVIC